MIHIAVTDPVSKLPLAMSSKYQFRKPILTQRHRCSAIVNPCSPTSKQLRIEPEPHRPPILTLIANVTIAMNQLKKDVNKVVDILEAADAPHSMRHNVQVSIDELDNRVEAFVERARGLVSQVRIEALEGNGSGHMSIRGEQEGDELRMKVKWQR